MPPPQGIDIVPPQPSLCPSSPQVVGVFAVQPHVPAVVEVAPLQVLLANPFPVEHRHVRSVPLGPSGNAESGPVEQFDPGAPPAE